MSGAGSTAGEKAPERRRTERPGGSSADRTAVLPRRNLAANQAGTREETGELCHHLPGIAQGDYGGKRDREE